MAVGTVFDDQPWFVLAAHDYSDDEAARILPPPGKAGVWKWATIRRRPHSLSVLTSILANPSLVRSCVSVFLAEKPYLAWLKLYEDLSGDPLNTPPLSRLGHADHLWEALADRRAMSDHGHPSTNAERGANLEASPGASRRRSRSPGQWPSRTSASAIRSRRTPGAESTRLSPRACTPRSTGNSQSSTSIDIS